MGFRLEIDGAGPVKLTERAITSVKFGSEIPQDSNARATDNGASIKIWGKLLFSLGGEEQDSTLNLAQWSLVPSESPDSYRNVKVDVVSACARLPCPTRLWWSMLRSWTTKPVSAVSICMSSRRRIRLPRSPLTANSALNAERRCNYVFEGND